MVIIAGSIIAGSAPRGANAKIIDKGFNRRHKALFGNPPTSRKCREQAPATRGSKARRAVIAYDYFSKIALVKSIIETTEYRSQTIICFISVNASHGCT